MSGPGLGGQERVGDARAGHPDEVGVARGDDRGGLCRLDDPPDAHDRQPGHGVLHGAGGCHGTAIVIGGGPS